ncbi:MAG TPA: ThiF family adenylyltransferase [Cyclobacteriaceae bacterium]|nr:ThiF family adenylyltransferase [Cyclobacteriaceae bacterium]
MPFVEVNENYRPLLLYPKSRQDAQKLEELKARPFIVLTDSIEDQVAELIKINNPSETFSTEELADRVKAFFKDTPKEGFGVWVYYPWRNTLVRVLDEADFIHLRTSRNKYKITQEEQDKLQSKTIGIIGLSVGQSVAISLAMERTFGELRIADFDTLDLSNLNRIRTGIFNLGLKKTWMVAREIAEIDPFLKVTVYEEGITEGNIHDFFTLGGNLDLLVEECDSLPIKISSRLKAKSLGIPVLMDTSDRGMMDVERFDLDPSRPIFHGMLQKFGEERFILESLNKYKNEMMMGILDFNNLSDRAKESISLIGKTITTWPQTASSVIMGGAACAYFSRKLLLDETVASGRYYIDLDEHLKIPHED